MSNILSPYFRIGNKVGLFEDPAPIIGYGLNDFYVEEIERKVASDIISKNHYSKKSDSVAHNKINLGLYINGNLFGVIQMGLAMHPKSISNIVSGIGIGEYLELNRMWINDDAEKNTASRFISYSVKLIKKKYPKIKLIQSFADERCDKLGIVYQACNFKYYGFHKSVFFIYDNKFYHGVNITNTKRNIHKILIENKDKISKVSYRQFRYIYFINQKCIKDCLLKEMPYPKHYNENYKKTEPVSCLGMELRLFKQNKV